MKTINIFSILLIISLMANSSCQTSQPSQKSNQNNQEEVQQAMPSPPVIIYKTRSDFFNQVPILFSPDHKSIVSYPAPGDLFYKGRLALPFQLIEGYLLDNRGINKDVGFLDLTYQEYSEYQTTPSREELMKHVISFDPLVEMYQCGVRGDYKDLENDLNAMILSNDWSKCVKLK